MPTTLVAARRVSELAVVWTLTASTLAVILGVESASVALVTFGAVGYVDAAGSIALVHHFRHALAHEALEDRFERRAHMVVSFGLVSVGSAAIIVGALRVVQGGEADASVAAIVLDAVSVIALVALSARKIWVGKRVPSAALVADGHLSAVGALQAFVTLIGLSVPGADAAAAMIVGAVAVGLGARSLRQLGRTDPAPSAPGS
jgi:divalent metal cation (Fe/Co/Zn/Cd) transporter